MMERSLNSDSVACKTGLDVLGKFSELAGCPGSEINMVGHSGDL